MNQLTLAVAAYNIESFIEECLASIQNQTNRDFDLMIIDDGSTDATGSLVDGFAPSFPGIRVVHQANAGISCVRNRMIELCETEYIWMIDGDDVIPPDAVEKLLPCLDGNREAVYFSYSRYGEPEKRVLTGKLHDLTAEQITALRYKCMLRDPEPLIQQINANSSVMSAHLVRSLRDHHVQFEPGRKVGGDVLFTGHFLACAKSLAYLDASLYIYRVNEGSVSLKYHKGFTERNIDIYKHYKAYVAKYFPGDRHMHELFLGRVLGTAVASIQLEICHPHNPNSYADRRAQYLDMLRNEQIKEALRGCPDCYVSRNNKIYRWCMRRGLFFPVNAFAHLIMRKRYIVFGAHGGKIRK